MKEVLSQGWHLSSALNLKMELVMRISYKKRVKEQRRNECKGLAGGKHLINSRDSMPAIHWASGRSACPIVGKVVGSSKSPAADYTRNQPSSQNTKKFLLGQVYHFWPLPLRGTCPLSHYVKGIWWSPPYESLLCQCISYHRMLCGERRIRWDWLDGAWKNQCQRHAWLRRW